MSSTTLIRWSGLALMIGGIVRAVGSILHPPGETLQFALDPLWVPSHWLGGIAYLLISLGLIGLYARQSGKVGLPGLIGFILSHIGLTQSAGELIYLSVVIFPFLAARGLDWFDPPNGAFLTSSPFPLVGGLRGASLVLGMLLFAIVTLRARVLPRWGAWLVIVSFPLGIVLIPLAYLIGGLLQGILIAFPVVVLGVGFVTWGWALWTEKPEAVSQAQPAHG